MGKEDKERQPQPEKLTLEKVLQLTREKTLKEGGCEPTLLIEGSQKLLVTTISELDATHEGRKEQMFNIGWLTGSMGAIGTLEQVFSVTEGWLTISDTEKSPSNPQRQSLNRIEVLVVSQYDLNSNEIDIRMQGMIRDATGNLIDLQELPLPQEEGVTKENPLLTAFVQGYVLSLMQPPQEEM